MQWDASENIGCFTSELRESELLRVLRYVKLDSPLLDLDVAEISGQAGKPASESSKWRLSGRR